MTPHSKVRLFVLLFAIHSVTASGQEGSWSLSAVGGYAYLDLQDIDGDNASDVEGYRRATYDLPDFPSLRSAFAFGGKITYRFERDYSFSLIVYESSRQVSSRFSRPQDSLALTRSVGSTAFLVGIAQHFEPVQDVFDWYAELHIGILAARAGTKAYQTHTLKRSESDPTPITEVTDDTYGEFRKSKLIVGAGIGSSLYVARPFFLKADLIYRFAKIGKMETDLTTLTGKRAHITSVDFNFSGFFLLVGLGVEL